MIDFNRWRPRVYWEDMYGYDPLDEHDAEGYVLTFTWFGFIIGLNMAKRK